LGWKLPLDETDPDRAMVNLLIDILGRLLSPHHGRDYGMIFENLERQGFSDYDAASDEQLEHCLQVQIRGFVKKELSRLTRQEDPQIANLKRRIDETLRDEEYASEDAHSKGQSMIWLRVYKEDLRIDKPLIPYEDLVEIVREQAQENLTRTSWCRAVFDALNELTQYQNRLKRFELFNAMIHVSFELVELEGFQQAHLPTPRQALLQLEFAREKDATIEWLKSGRVAQFRNRDVLTALNVTGLVQAVDRYLTDLTNGGETDSLPQYFRESMPAETHDNYLKDFKHIFETLIRDAEEEFKTRVKKNPTIRGIGGYL
jgi:hypothetical protein